MGRVIFAVILGALAFGCGQALQADTSTDLVKETYTTSGDSSGALEFQIPGSDPADFPMIQVFVASENKFSKVYLHSSPFSVDALGMVRADVEPNQHAIIVVVRSHHAID